MVLKTLCCATLDRVAFATNVEKINPIGPTVWEKRPVKYGQKRQKKFLMDFEKSENVIHFQVVKYRILKTT